MSARLAIGAVVVVVVVVVAVVLADGSKRAVLLVG
jgi:hypothetical protein